MLVSSGPAARHQLPPTLRAPEACAGKFGLCCPNSSGDYDSCCDMSLLNKEAKSGEGGPCGAPAADRLAPPDIAPALCTLS